MNIREAKDEIKKTVEIYLDKNEFGEYTLPVSKQRPVFMLGAPGIGKTEAVRQIAAELDIAFVPCSMTHYTRQGILGRSVAETRDYEGRKAVVSEYTMGRVIAAVYNVMQDSGKHQLRPGDTYAGHTFVPAIQNFGRSASAGRVGNYNGRQSAPV